MSTEKNADGYFRYRETYEGVKIDLTAKSEKDLIEKVRRRKNEIDSGNTLTSKNITVKTWCDEWLQTYKKDKVSDPYYKAIKGYFKNYIYPEIGSLPLNSIRPIQIQKLLNANDNKSASTVTKIKAALSEAFRQAVIERYITVSPVTATAVPKTAKAGSHRALTDEERGALLKVCETHYAGLWVKVMLYCGLRPQETVPLTWGDIDFDKQRITIRKALKRSGKVGTPKTDSGIRRIPIPDILFDELKQLPRGDKDEYVFKTERIKNTNKGGRRLYMKSMQRRWDSIIRAMKIYLGAHLERNKIIEDEKHLPVLADDLQLYCLRHTYCTDLMRAGVLINTAKALMGHSDVRMVDRVYGHFTEDQSDTALGKINQLFIKKNESRGTDGEP